MKGRAYSYFLFFSFLRGHGVCLPCEYFVIRTFLIGRNFVDAFSAVSPCLDRIHIRNCPNFFVSCIRHFIPMAFFCIPARYIFIRLLRLYGHRACSIFHFAVISSAVAGIRFASILSRIR